MSDTVIQKEQQSQILVSVTGNDSPGISAALCDILAHNQATLLDIEQVVLHQHITLCLLIAADAAPTAGTPVLKDLLLFAQSKDLQLNFSVLDPGNSTSSVQKPIQTSPWRYVLTLLASSLDAKTISCIGHVLANYQANIDRIRRLSSESLSSLELMVSLPSNACPHQALRADLLASLRHLHIDVAVQRENLMRRNKRLVVMDMDSTLIKVEVIDELARLHGVYDQVATITERAMQGELDFEASLRQRVEQLKGLSFAKATALAETLPLTEGAESLTSVLRYLGYRTAVVSGGFMVAAQALQKRLALDDAFANQLEVEDGLITGKLQGPIITPAYKAQVLSKLAAQESIHLEQTVAIGDGANDIPMLQKAGLGIAFHAKAKLREAADTTVSAGGLDRILYFLGLSAQDVQDALAHASAR